MSKIIFHRQVTSELPYVKGYIDGCIPLVLVMVVMIVINVMIKGKIF